MESRGKEGAMSSEEAPKTPNNPAKLSTGMELRGTVKNIELYGAFVDINTGQDALLHISQLGKPNVRNVEDVVKVGDEITVYVLKVDRNTGRVALSLVKPSAVTWDTLKDGMSLTGKVVRVEKFGVFVEVGAERPGMVHISELADSYVKTPSDVVKVGEEVSVRVLKVDRRKRQIDLTMKSQPMPVETLDEPDEEEIPNAMTLAFRKAMDAEGKPLAQRERPRPGKPDKRREQEEILARTLREHSSN